MSWPAGIPPKAEVRAALRAAYPWLDDDRFGPRNVTAGDCDRCAAEPRLVLTCGPAGGEYGRACAVEDDWCEGHADEAADALRWLAALPAEADDVAYLWWLTTGELRMDRALNSEPLAVYRHIQSSARGRSIGGLA